MCPMHYQTISRGDLSYGQPLMYGYRFGRAARRRLVASLVAGGLVLLGLLLAPDGAGAASSDATNVGLVEGITQALKVAGLTPGGVTMEGVTPPGARAETYSRLSKPDSWAASTAAPTMPAVLRSSAGMIGGRSLSSGRNFSCFLETPPPTTIRSGENSFSISSK